MLTGPTGMSTKVSQILGLEVDCSKLVTAGKISHDDMLDRNWAHWTAFSLVGRISMLFFYLELIPPI